MFINRKQHVLNMSTLFTGGKGKILKFILDNPTREIKVREVARILKLSPAHVSRTLKILRKMGLVKDNRVDLKNPLARAMKIFINVEKLVEKKTIDKIKSLNPIGAGIYGSWANGTNHEDSDLDIWIKFKKHPAEVKIASVVSEIRRSIGSNVHALILTPEKIEKLKKDDPIFYCSLAFGSIVIYGEPLE